MQRVRRLKNENSTGAMATAKNEAFWLITWKLSFNVAGKELIFGGDKKKLVGYLLGLKGE